QGAIAGTVTNSGGTAPNAVLTVSGGVYQNYYNTKSNAGLNNVATWSTTTDGTGASPANFTDAYQYFNIINSTNATYTGVWDVTSTGNSSAVVVGDGVNPITFIIKPAADSVTSATRIDVTNNATLQIENNRRPFINILAIGSTVNYAQNGTTSADSIRIPALTYYNLTLTNGLKFLSGNTTTVRGNFTATNVASFNGNAVSPFSTINAFGDVNFTATTFDIGTAGEAGRLTLAMNGNNGSQEINGNGGEIRLFRLQRDTTSSSSSINVGPSTIIILGNPSGGGLRLNQGAATTTVLELGDNTLKFNGGAVSTTTSNGKIAVSGNLGQIEINKNAGTTNAGILRFMPGSAVKNFIVNFDAAQTRDSITVANDLEITGILTLTKGKLVVSTGAKLTLLSTGSITGGSTASFIDGKIQFNFSASTSSVIAQVGKGTKYAPVTIAQPTSAANAYTVEYFFSSYGNFTINPTTLVTYPSYMVSAYEYWNIDQTTAINANLTFNYTDANSIIVNPLGVRMAQFNTGAWYDLGGTPNPANTASLGSVAVTGVNTFGPFTFSAINGTVLPVKLEYIRGQKSGAQNVINWKLTCLSTRVTMEVERGNNSRQFTSIHTIQATQDRCALPFDFNDAAPLNGSNFYRIKITDVDGQVSYSPVVAISNGKRNVEIAGLYPSVVYQTTSLSVAAAKATTIEAHITDMSGRIVKSFRQAIPQGSSMVPVQCENLAAGMYQLIITSDGLSNETIRFIKR
ncbi:MAG: T9SS type A sorting domain-containing protein, partial [Ferruginibacter sp.]